MNFGLGNSQSIAATKILSRNSSCQQLEAASLLEQATVGLYLYAIHIQGRQQDRTLISIVVRPHESCI